MIGDPKKKYDWEVESDQTNESKRKGGSVTKEESQEKGMGEEADLGDLSDYEEKMPEDNR